MLFNYDKYDHYIIKNLPNTERKPHPSSVYKNPYIKIKKKQRSA